MSKICQRTAILASVPMDWILICPSDKADCRMDMYNADGSQGIMCGNGVRCVGKYAYDHGIVDKDRRTITVETLGGIRH